MSRAASPFGQMRPGQGRPRPSGFGRRARSGWLWKTGLPPPAFTRPPQVCGLPPLARGESHPTPLASVRRRDGAHRLCQASWPWALQVHEYVSAPGRSPFAPLRPSRRDAAFRHKAAGTRAHLDGPLFLDTKQKRATWLARVLPGSHREGRSAGCRGGRARP